MAPLYTDLDCVWINIILTNRETILGHSCWLRFCQHCLIPLYILVGQVHRKLAWVSQLRIGQTVKEVCHRRCGIQEESWNSLTKYGNTLTHGCFLPCPDLSLSFCLHQSYWLKMFTHRQSYFQDDVKQAFFNHLCSVLFLALWLVG